MYKYQPWKVCCISRNILAWSRHGVFHARLPRFSDVSLFSNLEIREPCDARETYDARPLRAILWGFRMVVGVGGSFPDLEHAFNVETEVRNTGACEKTPLLREPWPCNPAAETVLQPLIWCF